MSPIKSARPLVRAFFCGLAASIIAGAALAQTPAPTQDAPKPSDTPPADKTANSNVITAHVAAPRGCCDARPVSGHDQGGQGRRLCG